MEDLIRYNKTIIESIKLLALPYEQQSEYFPSFVDTPFEILDTFENAFLLLPQLVEENYFSNNGIASLLRIHNWIAMVCSKPVLKDLDENQFDNHSDWKKLRDLAKEAIIAMGEPIEKPNKDYL